MPKRDPHAVLGVSAGASAAAIKAAWRRLARENHPDLIGDDPAAARSATRRMAEINAAYESLRGDGRDGRARPGAAGPGHDRDAGAAGARAAGEGRTRRGGPPRPRPERPVTGRVDTSQTFRPRNQTTTRAQHRARFEAPPLRTSGQDREPPRASEPTGPARRARIRHFRPPPAPPLPEAREQVIDFGKFRGHTLGEIGAFEPSYIDWLTRTITRDPDLVAAARVVRDDLDRRGVVRRPRPEAARPAPSADGSA